jgi:hypothetical protein
MIAYKSRNPGPVITWRLSVLVLKTMQSYPLAERRDVDDQVEWLGNSTIMYGIPTSNTIQPSANVPGVPVQSTGSSIQTDTWTVPASGGGSPRMLMAGAWSTELVQR